MPYVLEHDLASGWRALWELSETEDYFLDLNVWSEDDLQRLTQMENPARRMQWLATRFILKDKLGAKTLITKNKQGKFTPGMHIPILPPEVTVSLALPEVSS